MIRSISKLGFVALAISAVPAESLAGSLGVDACKVHRDERNQLIASGVKSDMSGGPAAFRVLDAARQKAVRRYIQVEETLLFRCARFLPQLPKEATPTPVVAGSSTTSGPAAKLTKPAAVSAKQRKLKSLRARLAAERIRKVRRVELSKTGSTSKVFEDETKAAWKKRLASFRRGDPLGAQPPRLPLRSPLQKRRFEPAPNLPKVPRAPAGIPKTSLPIKDTKKVPGRADTRKTAQAAVAAQPAATAGDQTPALLRGSIFSLPSGKNTKGWDKSIFDNN